MNFSANSEKYMKHLLEQFEKSNTKKTPRLQKKTDDYLSNIYADILESYKYIETTKNRSTRITFKLSKIRIPEQIPKGNLFDSSFVPYTIKRYIEQHAVFHLTYNCKLEELPVTINFVLLSESEFLKPEKYENYVERILVWLKMCKQYSVNGCTSKTLDLYFYLTPFKKRLPESSITVIGPENVNSGVTIACGEHGEILIFREEEWFKVFIHETMHSFGLDFSLMDTTMLHNRIKYIIPVLSDVNVHEAYSETWARIMNVLFCSFYMLEDKTDRENFLLYSNFCLQFEKEFAVFQIVKVLFFMGLQYEYLYIDSANADVVRKMLYKEKTSVLAYYILTGILMSDIPEFLRWCSEHNSSFVGFTKTLSNLDSFYLLIERQYMHKKLLYSVERYEKFLREMIDFIENKETGAIKNVDTERNEKRELSDSMRMSICEI